MSFITRFFSFLAILSIVLSAGIAEAHKPSDSFLFLDANGDHLSGEWDIAIRDLENLLQLDENADGRVTWGELHTRKEDISACALASLSITSGADRIPLTMTDLRVTQHTDGAYAVLSLDGTLPARFQAITVDYEFLFSIDPLHRGILRTASGITVLRPDRRSVDVAFGGEPRTASTSFRELFREGVWHIWIGIDHILFLLALLIPAVLKFEDGKWSGVKEFRPALVNILKIVTSFTVAHSITLGLATLDVVHLPSRLVESTIAASIVVATLNNFRPLVRENAWLIAFVFGLIHGFGFAGALAELELGKEHLLTIVLGFNLGVEAGQLAIVAAFFPVAYLLRESVGYRRLVLVGGSAVITIVAIGWFIERAFDMGFMPI